jgi:CHASE2 domain-containing sensor protein
MTTRKPTQPQTPLQRAVSIFKTATRPIVRKGWGHWLRFAVLLIAGSYIGHELSDSPRFTDWRYWLYQKQVRIERRGPVYPKYTALVMLDDDDYWSEEYQGRSKYKRDKLAALLDRLNAAGVNTVAFDIFMEPPFPDKPDYEFPDYRAEDEAFYQALTRMCAAGRHVVLATEYWESDHPNKISEFDQAPSVYGNRLASLPCVTLGHVDFANDMRKVPGMMEMTDGHYIDSLSLAITKITDPIAYHSLVENEDKGFRFGQFLTPADFATREGRQFIFSGHEIKDMSLTTLHEALADKTVIVGGHYHPAAYKSGSYIDMWDSPGGLEPGVMLHANFVEAMRDPESTFTPISDHAAEVFEWSLAMVLALVGALEVHVGWKWLGFIVSFLAAVVVAYALLQNLGIFLDFFIPILIILLHTMTEAVLEMRHEIHHLKHQLHTHQKKVSEEHP